MSVRSDVAGGLDVLARMPARQWGLRVVILASAVFSGLSVGWAGGGFEPWLLVPLVLLAVAAALVPDSSLGLLVVLLVGGSWMSRLDDDLSWWTPAAAAGLLVFHVACTLAAYGPATLELDPALLRRWLNRIGIAASVTALVWLAARVLSGLDLPDSGLVAAAALLLLTGWATVLGRRMAD